MTSKRSSGLIRRRPRDFNEWRALRRWGKLNDRESQQPGNVLRSIRLDAGLTQKQIAARIARRAILKFGIRLDN